MSVWKSIRIPEDIWKWLETKKKDFGHIGTYIVWLLKREKEKEEKRK